MDVLLWAAVATALIALTALIARYRIIALAAALFAGAAVLVDFYGNYQDAPTGPEESADRDSPAMQAQGTPVAWSRLYIDSTSDPQSRKPANISALSIAGTNVGKEAIKLDEAYFVSGVDGNRLNARIGRDGMRYKVQDLGPLPPGAFFFVVSEPIGPTNAGLNPGDFLKTWATIYFVAKYNGSTQRIAFDRRTVESLLPTPSQP
jgi:hypothetical protein